MATEPPKDHLGVVVVGHVDAGKSTTTGHLLFKLGSFDKREMEKLQKIADENGKSTFAFAYYLDQRDDERARGITIDCATKEFFTKTKHYSVVDAPGHKDFIKNMVNGASTADVAILMVPAELGGFEKAIASLNREEGQVEGQTRQHAQLCNLIGIRQLIVCVNKMDDPSVNFSEARFNEIKDEVCRMLAQAGYGMGKSDKVLEKIPFIPISGLMGHNLFGEKCDEMPWYNGFKVKNNKPDGTEVEIEGVTLYDALESYVQMPKRETAKRFLMPVGDILKIPGVGDVITGRIEQGQVKKGDVISFVPGDGSGKSTGKVFSIEMHHRTVDVACAGDNVGINVKNLSTKVNKGDVVMLESERRNPIARFTAQVVVQDHPGQLKPGFCPIIFVRTGRAAYRMAEIKWKIGKSTNKAKVENPEYIEYKDQAEIVFEAQKNGKQLYMETYADCEGLGRVVIMDSNSLVMLGKVTNVEYAISKEEAKAAAKVGTKVTAPTKGKAPAAASSSAS